MKARSYKLTFSLEEGYGTQTKVHRLAKAETVIKTWLTQRLKADQPIVAGLLQQGTLLFPSKNTAQGPVTVSPTAVFTGELTEPEDSRRSNKEVKTTLESLATALKAGLKQESVFIAYRDKTWCV